MMHPLKHCPDNDPDRDPCKTCKDKRKCPECGHECCTIVWEAFCGSCGRDW